MDEKPITRIDLERAGLGIAIYEWRAGWKTDGSSAPDIMDYVNDKSMDALLHEFEQQGFTVWISKSRRGHALRGEITRIDFKDGEIHKFPFGWTAYTPPLQRRQASADEIATAIQWCKSHGWTVFEWPGGARAWKGKPMPVYDTSTIQRIRNIVNANPADPRRHYDLAFYF